MILISSLLPGNLLAIPGNRVIGKRNPVISTHATRATRVTHACMRPRDPVPGYFLRDAWKLAVTLARFKPGPTQWRMIQLNHYATMIWLFKNILLLNNNVFYNQKSSWWHCKHENHVWEIIKMIFDFIWIQDIYFWQK